MMMEGKVMLEM